MQNLRYGLSSFAGYAICIKRRPGDSQTARGTGTVFKRLAVITVSKPSLMQGGVLTTASAIGFPLIQRLRDAGMKFEVAIVGCAADKKRN